MLFRSLFSFLNGFFSYLFKFNYFSWYISVSYTHLDVYKRQFSAVECYPDLVEKIYAEGSVDAEGNKRKDIHLRFYLFNKNALKIIFLVCTINSQITSHSERFQQINLLVRDYKASWLSNLAQDRNPVDVYKRQV